MAQIDTEMRAAYRMAAALHLKRDPQEAAEVADINHSELLVVPGHYDHAERVFDLAGVSHTLVPLEQLGTAPLRAEQMLFINCRHDEWNYRWLDRIAEFIREGGLLVTTDWSVGLLTRLFPETVRRLGRPGAYKVTPNDVVSVEVREPDHPMLKGFAEVNDKPVWWLEGSSWLYEVSPDVDVLIASREMQRKYGAGLVAVSWPSGRGLVIHMISHFYLQQTELRNAKDMGPSSGLAEDLEVDSGEVEKLAGVSLNSVSYASARDAYTSYRNTLGMLKAKEHLRRKQENHRKAKSERSV